MDVMKVGARGRLLLLPLPLPLLIPDPFPRPRSLRTERLRTAMGAALSQIASWPSKCLRRKEASLSSSPSSCSPSGGCVVVVVLFMDFLERNLHFYLLARILYKYTVRVRCFVLNIVSLRTERTRTYSYPGVEAKKKQAKPSQQGWDELIEIGRKRGKNMQLAGCTVLAGSSACTYSNKTKDEIPSNQTSALHSLVLV